MLNMNGNDERGIVPVLNSGYSTVKIDSLCIKLGITKEKDDDGPKCRHFSIRGYVAGMREEGRSNLLPFAEELPPMDIPNFRYWLCQRCLQNNETANASNETTIISVCDHCVFPPARSSPPQNFNAVTVLPLGEGTSGLKPVDSMNDDEIVLAALGADVSQTSQDKVKISQDPSKGCTIDTTAGKKESDGLEDHENPQKTSIVNETISQPSESGEQNDNNQNGLPRRKARKVRLLKELLCGNTEIQQHKRENSSPLMAPSSQIKRKMLHDHDHNYQHHKKMKTFKGNTAAKTSEVEHPRNQEAREFGENLKKYEWNKHGTQKNSILGWRSIFSDVRRSDKQLPPTCGTSKSRGTDPYPNLMNPPKSDKKVNSVKKITSYPIKSNFFVEDSRRMKDNNRSHAELELDLSLNYDAQSHIRSLNQPPSQDYNRNSSFFLLGESSNFPQRLPLPSDPKSMLHEKQLYTHLPYGHQKLDFSDPYKRNIGVKRPIDHQRQDNMLSVGRSDEHEIIELLAKNQYERNLSEANNGIVSGFHRLNMNEGYKSSHPEYPTSDNAGPMRNPAGSLFHQDQVSSFIMNQTKPLNGVWISDSRSQRHYHYASNGNIRIPQTHLYNAPDKQAHEAFNKYNNVGNQNEAACMQFGHTYAKYSDQDKGKNMMDLDLNLVAPNVVEEHNNVEPLEVNPNRVCSFDSSSYSNEAIPAMQLLSLMDAGKSSQPFTLTPQPFITKPKPKPKPVSICYSHCSSTVHEKTNPLVNPIGGSFFSMFQTGQNIRLTSSHGQQVYHKPLEEKSLASVSCRPEGAYVFPLPWHASEGQTKVANRAIGPRFDSSRTEICTINQNPADFSTPGPENEYMLNVEDLIFNGGCSYNTSFTSENGFGPKFQRRVMKPTF